MKKIKNKFIILIIFIISIIIFLQLFITYFLNKTDRNSYVVLIEWQWIMSNIYLNKDERNIIEKELTVKSVWADSVVIIEWWDWSITRLWWDTEILIEESEITDNLSKINISFSLLSWRTWSNVISFFWKDSYFTQSFDDLEAWVRWTVFNVDLEKAYINVISHEVLLRNNKWQSLLINENNPFSLKNLRFIEVKEFIKNTKNKAWEEYNKKFDKEYLEELYYEYKGKAKLSFSDSVKKSNPFTFFQKKHVILKKIKKWINIGSLKNIAKNLSEREREFLYEEILYLYQNIHFTWWENLELFKSKLYYKRVLFVLADNENKEHLLKSASLDLKDSLSIFEFGWNIINKDIFKDSLRIFDENKELLKNINVDLWKTFIDIPKELEIFMWEKIRIFKSSVWVKQRSIDWIKWNIWDIKKKAEEWINNSLNTIFWN